MPRANTSRTGNSTRGRPQRRAAVASGYSQRGRNETSSRRGGRAATRSSRRSETPGSSMDEFVIRRPASSNRPPVQSNRPPPPNRRPPPPPARAPPPPPRRRTPPNLHHRIIIDDGSDESSSEGSDTIVIDSEGEVFEDSFVVSNDGEDTVEISESSDSEETSESEEDEESGSEGNDSMEVSEFPPELDPEMFSASDLAFGMNQNNQFTIYMREEDSRINEDSTEEFSPDDESDTEDASMRTYDDEAHGQSPRRAVAPKPPVLDIPTVPLDVSVHECIVCLTPITVEGEHRPVVLKCGHLFGRHCVEHWIKVSSKTCPSCKAKSTLRDVRLVYARSVTAEDNSSLLEAQQKATNLASENARLLSKNDELEKRLQLLAQSACSSSMAVSSILSVSPGIRVLPNSKMMQKTDAGVGGRSHSSLDVGGQYIYTTCAVAKQMFAPFGIVRIDVDGTMSSQVPCHTKKIRVVCVNPSDMDVVASASDDRTVAISRFTGSNAIKEKSIPISAQAWSLTWFNHDLLLVGGNDGKMDCLNWKSDEEQKNPFFYVQEPVPIWFCHYVSKEQTLITITGRGCSAYRCGQRFELLNDNIRSYAYNKATNKVALAVADGDGVSYTLHQLDFGVRKIKFVNSQSVDLPPLSKRLMHGALFQNLSGTETIAVYDETLKRVIIHSIPGKNGGKPDQASVPISKELGTDMSQVLATPFLDENKLKHRITLISATKFVQFLILC